MKNINAFIGKNIRYYREKKGWSQEELAERSGYDVNTKKSSMSKIENGKNDIPTSRLYAIAMALGVEVTDLTKEDPTLETRTCDLFTECYGHEAYQAVQAFLKLDQHDRDVIYGRILGMLDTDKYTPKKESTIG